MNEILNIQSRDGSIQVSEVICSIASALQPVLEIEFGSALYSIEKKTRLKIPEWNAAREWVQELNEHDLAFIKANCLDLSEKITARHISKSVREYEEHWLEDLTTLKQKIDYYAQRKLSNIKMTDCFQYAKLLEQAKSKLGETVSSWEFVWKYESDFLDAKKRYDKVRDGHFDQLNEMLKNGSLKGVLTTDRIPPQELSLTMQLPIEEVRVYLKSSGFQLQVESTKEKKASLSLESDKPSDPNAILTTAGAGNQDELPMPEIKHEQNWNLKKPKTIHGYTMPLYELLKEAKTQGRPLPTAYDVLTAFRSTQPQQVISFDQDGFTYYDSNGNSKSAGIKAIREAIRRMTPK